MILYLFLVNEQHMVLSAVFHTNILLEIVQAEVGIQRSSKPENLTIDIHVHDNEIAKSIEPKSV